MSSYDDLRERHLEQATGIRSAQFLSFLSILVAAASLILSRDTRQRVVAPLRPPKPPVTAAPAPPMKATPMPFRTMKGPQEDSAAPSKPLVAEVRAPEPPRVSRELPPSEPPKVMRILPSTLPAVEMPKRPKPLRRPVARSEKARAAKPAALAPPRKVETQSSGYLPDVTEIGQRFRQWKGD